METYDERFGMRICRPIFIDKALYWPDLAERFELMGGICWPTTCAGYSRFEDWTGIFVEEMNEVEARDYKSSAEEDRSGIAVVGRLFDAVDVTDTVACFPFEWEEILFNEA